MRRLAWYTAIVLLTLTAAMFVWQIRQVVVVFALSLALAATARPAVTFLVQRRVPVVAAILVTYLLGVAVVGGLVFVASGRLFVDLQRASDNLASSWEQTTKTWPSGTPLQQALAARLPPLDAVYGLLAGPQGSALFESLVGITASLAEILSSAGLVLVLSVYWVADQVHFERLWLSLLPVEPRMRVRNAWREIEAGVGAVIRNQLAQGLMAGLLLAPGYLALGMPYPILLATVGAVLRLIPLIGIVLALVPVVVVGFLEGGVLVGSLGIVYTLVVFAVLEWLVEPRLFRLPRYNTILELVIMLAMAESLGLVGLLAAPALSAAIQILLAEVFDRRTGVTAPAAPAPQLAELLARLQAARAQALEDGSVSDPETAGMLGRLDRLVAAASDARREP